MPFGVVTAVASGIEAISSINSAQSAKSSASKQSSRSAKMWKEQQGFEGMLEDLLKDPSSIYDDPGYQSTLDQGIQGVNRGMAASGYLGSGNQQEALLDYSQKYASSYLQQRINTLASLSGISSYNPTSTENSAATINSSANSSTSDAYSSLGSAAASLQSLLPTFNFGA